MRLFRQTLLAKADFADLQRRLDEVMKDREVVAGRVEELVGALRRAGSELEAGNDRGAKHIIQDALMESAG